LKDYLPNLRLGGSGAKIVAIDAPGVLAGIQSNLAKKLFVPGHQFLTEFVFSRVLSVPPEEFEDSEESESQSIEAFDYSRHAFFLEKVLKPLIEFKALNFSDVISNVETNVLPMSAIGLGEAQTQLESGKVIGKMVLSNSNATTTKFNSNIGSASGMEVEL